MKCIFCDTDLDPKTKPEHILLASLGGRKTSRVVDCSNHNETFGSTIDKKIGEQIQVVRNLLQLESGTGKPPPALRGIKAGSATIDINSDGTPSRVGVKPFSVTDNPDGTKLIAINVERLEEIGKFLPHIAAAAKMSEDAVRDAIAKSSPTFNAKRPDTVHHHLSFGGDDALRSITKSALCLWALAVGNDEVKSAPYADARQFVLNGGDFSKRRIKLDSRQVPNADELIKRYGEFLNLLYIASDTAGRVVAHFTLYNIVSWQIVLAESSNALSRQTGLINNPLKPEVWTDKIADELPIVFDWLNGPAYSDFVRANERLNKMMEKHVNDSRDQEFGRIINDVLEKHGIKKGEPIPPALMWKISGEIAQRVAANALDLPYSEKITPEQIRKMLNG